MLGKKGGSDANTQEKFCKISQHSGPLCFEILQSFPTVSSLWTVVMESFNPSKDNCNVTPVTLKRVNP